MVVRRHDPHCVVCHRGQVMIVSYDERWDMKLRLMTAYFIRQGDNPEVAAVKAREHLLKAAAEKAYRQARIKL